MVFVSEARDNLSCYGDEELACDRLPVIDGSVVCFSLCGGCEGDRKSVV